MSFVTNASDARLRTLLAPSRLSQQCLQIVDYLGYCRCVKWLLCSHALCLGPCSLTVFRTSVGAIVEQCMEARAAAGRAAGDMPTPATAAEVSSAIEVVQASETTCT